MKRILSVLSLVGVMGVAQAAIKGEEVTYKAGETTLKGYLVYDDSSNKVRPGVVVIHEWWGHNDYTRKRARMLAEAGYIALAVDMYGDGKQADHPKDAGAFAGAVRGNLPVAKQRFDAAVELLQKHALMDKTKLAAVGYCFGGGIALEMARMGADLKGVVSLHGSLGTEQPAKKDTVKARLLVLTGAADPMIKPEAVDKFKAEMDAAGVKYKVVSYQDAKHAFTNPAATELGKKFDMPIAYDQKADKASWKEMLEFLQEVFK